MEQTNLDEEVATAVQVKSMNRRFREIKVHPEILEHIHQIGVGFKPRQRQAQKIERITSKAIVDRRRIAKVVGGLGSLGTPKRPLSVKDFKEAAEQEKEQQEQQEKQQQRPRYQRHEDEIMEEQKRPGPNPFEPPRPFGRRSFPVRIVGELTNADQALPLFLDNVPQSKIPQVAVCGRSNVGKSTLLNLLLYSNLAAEYERKKQEMLSSSKARGRGRGLETFRLPKGVKAVTSAKPGETKTITFYQLGSPHPEMKQMDLRILLVDLPGYGFAFADSDDKRNFQEMMRRYLTGDLKNQDKAMLKRILLLIDARHGMLPADQEFLEMIQRTLVTHAAHATRASGHEKVIEALVENEDKYADEDDDFDLGEDDQDEDDNRKGRDDDDDDEEEEEDSLSRRRRGAGGRLGSKSRLEQIKRQRREQKRQQKQIVKQFTLPPIQIVLTKCDLVKQDDLARRVVQVREQLSDALIREPSQVLPVMLVSSLTNHGVLELQKQLSTLAEAITPISPTSLKNPDYKWGTKPPPRLMPPTAEEIQRQKQHQKKKKRKKVRLSPPPLDFGGRRRQRVSKAAR
ncbi:hypothetical protein ACA910_014031 [Epithemia clementina (nom. ined.)]